MEQHFTRRVYNLTLLVNDLWYILLHIPSIIGAMRNNTITKAFIEKIMLVVTAVNECPYCAWFHANKAQEAGLSHKDIQAMLALQFDARANDYEAMALLYAQHYAETNRKPEPQMTQNLINQYGKKTAQHIILIIRLIFFGNLSGNTFDAFISRIKGKPAMKSNILFEFLFFIFSAPVLLPIMPHVVKFKSKQQR